MGKPAARLMDMTAHGGMITGPGCPTVLVGKMPAAQMGNMHMCPMVTPAVPPIPHVGGPLVGPVPPTVFVGKMPAACVGDMAICVGPPSSVLPPGGMTVMFGQSGSSGGGGGSTTAAKAASVLKGKAPKTVKGTETFPIEIQEMIARAAAKMKPKQVEKLVEEVRGALEQQKAAKEQDEEKRDLTLADIVEILKAIESEEGYEAARSFASYLDYSTLTDMAKCFVNGSNPEGNDPNQMPTRFMILCGADDTKLQEIDDHPDAFEGEEHKITVANLRKGLKFLGYKVKDSGPYDDELLRAHLQYLAVLNVCSQDD